jgi:hypothetical protein
MNITTLTPEELEFFSSLNDPMTIGELCEYLPWIRVGIRLDDNTLVGSITLFNINGFSHKAEFGMHIIHPKGTLVAAKAAKQFIKEAFERLNLNRIYARVHHDNTQCLNCIERFGFKFEGTERQSLLVCGKYKDILVYSILKSDIERGGLRVNRKQKLTKVRLEQRKYDLQAYILYGISRLQKRFIKNRPIDKPRPN